MNDAQLLDALRAANEYPSHVRVPEQIRTPAEALRVFDEGSGGHPESLLPAVHRIREPAPKGLVAVAVFAAIMIVGTAFLAMGPNRRSAPASKSTPIPLVGAEDSAVARDAFLAVESAYSAHGSDDGTAWFRAVFPPNVRNSKSWWAGVYATYALADERFDAVRCVSHGFGNWPGISEAEPFFEEDQIATGYRFECTMDETNRFHDAGGIVVRQVHDWVVADGAVVAAVVEGDFQEADAFNQDFRNWLLANHYDIFRSYETLPWLFPSHSSLGTALEYVGQFVKESPQWPRQPGG